MLQCASLKSNLGPLEAAAAAAGLASLAVGPLGQANALVDVPPETSLAEGASVTVLRFAD